MLAHFPELEGNLPDGKTLLKEAGDAGGHVHADFFEELFGFSLEVGIETD